MVSLHQLRSSVLAKTLHRSGGQVSWELVQDHKPIYLLILLSTFSPEGRLFQVEYSLEAIKLGSTAIGVRIDPEIFSSLN